MVERTNRRDAIIEVASRLFLERGYAATSVRQIAEEVGVTEAALYYHFKAGKRELLEAVVQCNMPDLIGAVEACQRAETLHDFIVGFARGLAARAREHMNDKMRWLIAEFPNLNEEERALLRAKYLAFRDALRGQVRRFVSDEREAQFIASALLFVMFGYGQLMITLDMQSVIDFDTDDFVERLAQRFAC